MKKAPTALAEEALEEELSPRYATPRSAFRKTREKSARPLEAERSPATRPLTAREKEILKCLSEGMTTRAVAEELLIAPVTVRNHIQRILQKLGVHSKLAAVVCAYRRKLI